MWCDVLPIKNEEDLSCREFNSVESERAIIIDIKTRLGWASATLYNVDNHRQGPRWIIYLGVLSISLSDIRDVKETPLLRPARCHFVFDKSDVESESGLDFFKLHVRSLRLISNNSHNLINARLMPLLNSQGRPNIKTWLISMKCHSRINLAEKNT